MKNAVLRSSRRADIAVAVDNGKTIAVFERSTWPRGRRCRWNVKRFIGDGSGCFRPGRCNYQMTDSLSSMACYSGAVGTDSTKVETCFTVGRACKNLYTRT